MKGWFSVERGSFVTRLARNFAALALTSAVFLAGCSGRSARIRDSDEPSLVGTRRAGAATYRNLIDGALEKLSGEYRIKTSAATTFTKIRVAFFGVDNSTGEELGTWRDQINTIVNDRVHSSRDFQDISFDRYVKPALRRAGVSKDNLVIPEDRRKFLRVLEQDNVVLDAFLFARLTQGDTRAGRLRQSDYILTLELIDPSNGRQIVMASREISKEYRS